MRVKSRLAKGVVSTVIATGVVAAMPTLATAEDNPIFDEVLRQFLIEHGVDPAILTDDLEERVNDRLEQLVDRGAIDPERVDELEDLIEDGSLIDRIIERVEDHRERLEEIRDALVEELEERGIDLEDGQSPRDALLDAGLDPDEIRDLIPERAPRDLGELLDRLPEGALDNLPEDIRDALLEGELDALPDELIDQLPDDLRDRIPERILDRIPDGLRDRLFPEDDVDDEADPPVPDDAPAPVDPAPPVDEPDDPGSILDLIPPGFFDEHPEYQDLLDSLPPGFLDNIPADFFGPGDLPEGIEIPEGLVD